MNPQRLVAAVAALAIGFGVTLVGVGFADEETVVSTDSEPPGAEITEPSRGGGAPAQDAEPAQEPGAAEAEEPASSAVEPSPQQGEVQDGTSESSTSAPTSTPFPSGGIEVCKDAVIVRSVDDRVVVLVESDVRFESDASGDDVAVLRVSGEPIDSYVELVANTDLVTGDFVDVGAGEQFFDCTSGGPVTENGRESLRNELLAIATTPDFDSPEEQLSLEFPCDSGFIEEFAEGAGLSDDLERVRVAGATDLDVLSFFVSVRALGVSQQDGSGQDLEFWAREVEQRFIGFRTDDNIVDACELLEESVGLSPSTRAGFFCAIGQLASDSDLLEFLKVQVPVDQGCVYPSVAETGSNGGAGSTRVDEGES